MAFTMDKFRILEGLESGFAEITHYCKNTEDHIFFLQSSDKWSIAENLKHLTLSVKFTGLAMWLHGSIDHLLWGKPNKPSRSYEQIVEIYQHKLEEGAIASKRFTPKSFSSDTSKEKLLKEWKIRTKKFLNIIRYYWNEQDFENFQFPHPILGKITGRELCYFTIYHNRHHLQAMKRRNYDAYEISAS